MPRQFIAKIEEKKKGADGKPQASNGRGKKASERTTTTPSKRTLATGPGAFKAAKTFQGTKPGYVFKLDKLGLGYYKDTQQLGGHNSDVSQKPPQLQKEKKGNKDKKKSEGVAQDKQKGKSEADKSTPTPAPKTKKVKMLAVDLGGGLLVQDTRLGTGKLAAANGANVKIL